MASGQFDRLAEELREFASAAVSDPKLSALSLRRILAFVVKVANVAEQAFQDVVPVLVEIKYLAPEDLKPNRKRELLKQVELLTSRSRYRDAEEICSRLHSLSQQYRDEIRPLLREVADRDAWYSLFRLIDEHEGHLIMIVGSTSRELYRQLETVNAQSLGAISALAAGQLEEIRRSLDQLRELSTRILGASGAAGLLEITATSQAGDASSSLFLTLGDIHVTRDHYEIGQAGAVGPYSQAQHMQFQQLWREAGANIDIHRLASELTTLRGALSIEASKPDDFVALGHVAAAEKAATEGNGPSALQHLKAAGAWVWDATTKVGIGVATAAAKAALGV